MSNLDSFYTAIQQHERARRAHSNISRAVTRWEKKRCQSVKTLKWHVVDSLSSEYGKPWKNALGELLANRAIQPCGYSLMIEDSERPCELWLMCDDSCVMYAAL